ncbi:MAG: Ig-like domain-containing protein [Pseudomonadota bacterium]
MAKINGDQNPNVLVGTAKRDTIKGLGGDDSLFGDAGNDILEGGLGADFLDGGDGVDRADYRKSKAGVTVNLGLNLAFGGEAEGDTFSSIENVFGTRYADTLTGDDGKNVLAGRNGDDTLNGEGGADRLLGGNGKDILNGGDDSDRLEGGRGADHLDGGNGTGDQAEYARSKAGVTVNLTTGTGQGGDAEGDTLVNVENLLGSKHNDELTGDGGANTLLGRDGDDELNGEDGDDILEGGKGADKKNGGEGSDTASYARSKQGVQVDLAAGSAKGGDAEGDTFDSIENLTGSRKSDTLSGDDEANTLSGGRGHDTLEGRGGDDDLNGGRGRDILDGGEGDDTLSGGRASDTYVYDKGDGADTIVDGGHKSKDVLKISGYEASQTFVQRIEGTEDLLISFGGENGGDSIIVKNTLGGSTADTLERFTFENGTTWTIADVITKVANEAPVAVDDLGSTILPDQPVVIPVANMLSNDSDPDGDELELVSVYNAEGGTVEITEEGDVVFTPSAGFSGTASFL